MAWNASKPADNEKFIDTPAQVRANWAALLAGSIWSGVATAGLVLKSAGAGSPPAWGLPQDLVIASQAQGMLLYFNGSNWIALAVGTAGNILKTQGAGANPAWTDTAPKAGDLAISSQARGDILYFNGTNWVRLPKGTDGQFLKIGANDPIWAAMGLPTDLAIASQEQGSLIYFNGTNWVQLAHGTAGQVLISGGHAANPSWGSGVSILTGTIAHGGTIPLPSGYAEAQCKWFVSAYNPRHSDRDQGGGAGYDCWANASRVVTALGRGENAGYGDNVPFTANYMIIGVK
jgi:hypothetical protein